jgi:hypothetical protein
MIHAAVTPFTDGRELTIQLDRESALELHGQLVIGDHADDRLLAALERFIAGVDMTESRAV